MDILKNFKIERNDDGSFDIESLISGNKVDVPTTRGEGNRTYVVVLWTILNDLYEEGFIKDKK